MDKNTITGIILIFAIFIGFSIFNSNRMNKSYKQLLQLLIHIMQKEIWKMPGLNILMLQV